MRHRAKGQRARERWHERASQSEKMRMPCVWLVAGAECWMKCVLEEKLLFLADLSLLRRRGKPQSCINNDMPQTLSTIWHTRHNKDKMFLQIYVRESRLSGSRSMLLCSKDKKEKAIIHPSMLSSEWNAFCCSSLFLCRSQSIKYILLSWPAVEAMNRNNRKKNDELILKKAELCSIMRKKKGHCFSPSLENCSVVSSDFITHFSIDRWCLHDGLWFRSFTKNLSHVAVTCSHSLDMLTF